MYRPYTKEDKLEVGTKIRLAGREGEIIDQVNKSWIIKWFGGGSTLMDLRCFTFEIEDIPPTPLKIDKRVKGEILCMMSDRGSASKKLETIDAYLNSLEEC